MLLDLVSIRIDGLASKRVKNKINTFDLSWV
jgi:hypothetical protein